MKRESATVRVISPNEIEGRLPPHDLDAEAAVLSSVLCDGARVDDVADAVKPEDFYAEAHAVIFRACLALRAEGKPIDYVQVGTALKASERIAQVGGMAYLIELSNAAPWVANVRAYAETVAKRALARRVIAAAQVIVAGGYVDHGDDAEYAASSAGALHEIAYEQKAGDVALAGDSLADVIRGLHKAQASGGMLGIATGFSSYDLRLSGLHAGDLTIVAARPGLGKTSYALGVALNLGLRNEPSVIFSLEMPRDQVALRLACMLESVSFSTIRSGKMSPRDWQKVTAAAIAIKQMPIWIDDTPGLSALDMRAKIRRVSAEERRKGRTLRLAVFDYLQLGRGTEDSREQVVAQLAQGMKDAAKEAGIAVLALSQLNREVEKRSVARPQLSDLRESGNIEQAADNIVFIWSEDKKDAPGKNDERKFTLAKHRNGATSEWEMGWVDTYARFHDLGIPVESRDYE